MNRLANKVTLITSSSRGIGAAIAMVFAQEGASVVVHGRDAQALAATSARIKDAGGRAMHVVADVTIFEEIEAMRYEVEQKFGCIDILVANVGGSLTKPGPLEETSEEGWHKSLHANLTAPFLTIKSVLPGMKQRGAGNIITVSSAAARKLYADAPIPYAAAKAGLELMTKHLAAQVGLFGVRVNCIAPDTILTERNNQRIPDNHKDKLIAQRPIQRLGTPDDVAQAALFLASNHATWISGIVMDVAGGAVLV